MAGFSTLPLMSACGDEDDRSDGAVRFEGWDYESALVQENVDRFMEINPDIQVDYTPITSAQYVQMIVAEFTGGVEPDALYVYDDSLASWVDAGYLQSLEGMPGLDEVYDRIYDSNAETMTYRGERYGLPYYTDTQCLAYNSEILDRAGFDAPPRSLEEWEEQAIEIKRQGIQEYPIGFAAQMSDTWWAWWWGMLFASDGDLFDDSLRPIMLDDPTARDVLDWLQRGANDSEIIDPASIQLLPIPADNAFMAGEYTFLIAARYAMREYNSPDTSTIAGNAEIGMIPSLDGRTEGTVSTTRMYSLTANTQRKEEAYELIYYLGGFLDGEPTTAKIWFEEQGLGFSFEELSDDSEIQDELATFADPEVYERLADVSRPRTILVEPWYTEFEASIQKTLQRVMTKQLTADQGVRELADSVERLERRYA